MATSYRRMDVHRTRGCSKVHKAAILKLEKAIDEESKSVDVYWVEIDVADVPVNVEFLVSSMSSSV
jgi:hypothetical protein